MSVLWLACAPGALGPNPCSALDTFLLDPGIELKESQVLELEHEEGERFDLFPVEEGAFDTIETHPSKETPIMLINTLNKLFIPTILETLSKFSLFRCALLLRKYRRVHNFVIADRVSSEGLQVYSVS